MKAERGWVFRGVLVGLVAVAMMSGCGGKDDDSTGGSTDAADTGSSTGGATMGAQTTGEDPASSTGTTAEPTGAADGPDCKTVCEVVTAHAGTNKCTNLPPDCEANCQKVHDLLVPCQSQWVALIDCQIGTTADDWMCDAMGGMTLKDGVCAAEDMAFDACTQG